MDAMDSLVDKDPDAEIIYVDDEYYTTLESLLVTNADPSLSFFVEVPVFRIGYRIFNVVWLTSTFLAMLMLELFLNVKADVMVKSTRDFTTICLQNRKCEKTVTALPQLKI